MNFDIRCINTTHNLYSKSDKLPENGITGIVHVTCCKCDLRNDFATDRIYLLGKALEPLAQIANEYENDGLDEHRPSWTKGKSVESWDDLELYSGRGGKELINLGHAMRAREVLYGIPIPKVNKDLPTSKILTDAKLCGAVLIDNSQYKVACIMTINHEGKHGWEK